MRYSRTIVPVIRVSGLFRVITILDEILKTIQLQIGRSQLWSKIVLQNSNFTTAPLETYRKPSTNFVQDKHWWYFWKHFDCAFRFPIVNGTEQASCPKYIQIQVIHKHSKLPQSNPDKDLTINQDCNQAQMIKHQIPAKIKL